MVSVFISYGHSDYAALADRIYKSLSAVKDGDGNLKYDVIKDNEGAIPPASNWDSSLEDAIKRANYIIFLMEQHSVRRDSVCLDEIAFARNRGGIAIIPVRVENTDTPLSICRLQWIDWQWYNTDFDNGISQICEAIENYETRIAQGVGSLFNKLYKADYKALIDHVYGREAIISEIENYIRSDNNKLFFLSGVAGTGKSAVVYELAKNSELVKSVHWCMFDDSAHTLKPKDVLCNLAYFLSCRNRAYADSVVFEELDKIGEWSLQKTFENLFVKHLKDEKDRYALIIDGVDEMDPYESRELIQVLKSNSSKLGGVKLIVSVRSEKRFERVIKGFPGIVLDLHNNKGAVEEYIAEALKKRGIYTEARKDKLLAAADGNFRYITYLFNEFDDGLIDIDSEDVPQDLIELYLDSLHKRFEDPQVFKDSYSRLLAVLCAAAAPMTYDELAKIIDVSDNEVKEKLDKLSYIIKIENQQVSLYHNSMKEFLLDYDKSMDYCIDAKEGHRIIAESASEMEAIKENNYLNKYLLYHIFLSKDKSAFELVYSQDEEFAINGTASALLTMSEKEYRSVMSVIASIEDPDDFIWDASGALLRSRETEMVQNFVHTIKEKYPFVFFLISGDCNSYSDRIQDSKEDYKQALTIALEDYEKQPSYKNRRRLSDSYGRLAQISMKEDDIKEAKRLYLLRLELNQQNAEQFPSYESCGNLSISYNNLADIAFIEEDIDEAKRWYLLSMEIRKQNAERFPSYYSRRALSISYSNLANIAHIQDKIEEAKRLYSLSLELDQQNAETFPSYESRRDLSLSYGCLADIAKEEDNIEEAKRLYLLRLELIQQNAEQFPSYESRRDLSVSYKCLSSIAKKEDDNKEDKRLCLLSLELDRQNAEQFPSYESREDLSVSYGCLADIAKREDDIKEAKRLYILSMQLFQQNAEQFPSYESRRCLSLSYGCLASIATKEDDIEEAKRLYYLSLELDRQNAEQFPSYDSRRCLLLSYGCLAGIAIKKDDIEEAKRLYLLSLELSRQNAEQFPSYESRRALSVSYDRLADIAMKEGDIEEAKRLCLLCLELVQQNVKQFPSYESRRDLSECYGMLADITDKEDDIEEAKQLYLLSMELKKQNAEQFLSYESRRNLSLSYNRLADIAMKEGDIKEAKRLCLLGFELVRQNVEQFSSIESRRDLSESYGRLADIADKEDDIEEAKRFYLLSLELKKQNAEQFPSYESRRDLSVNYESLADIALERDDIEEAKRLFLLSLELKKQNADQFPSCESRRDLSISYNSLAEIAFGKGDIEAAKRLYLLSLELIQQNAEQFPSYENQRLLSLRYRMLAVIAHKEGDRESAERYEQLAEQALNGESNTEN